MEFSYEYFVDCMIDGDYREFWYHDKILIVSCTSKSSVFEIEHLGKIIRYCKFKTPQDLLENVRVDGKSLKDIWDDLSLA